MVNLRSTKQSATTNRIQAATEQIKDINSYAYHKKTKVSTMLGEMLISPQTILKLHMSCSNTAECLTH